MTAIAAPLSALWYLLLSLISECGAFGTRHWPTQPLLLPCGIVSEARKPKTERKRRASSTATSLLLRTSLTSFTSSRNFPDPRRLDALRRYPCQRNAAIPLYRVYIATACLHFVPLFPSSLLVTFLPVDFFQFFSFVSARHSRNYVSRVSSYPHFYINLYTYINLYRACKITIYNFYYKL